MRFTRYDSASEFLSAAEPTLSRQEARHALLLGLARQLHSGAYASFTSPPFLSAIHGSDGLLVVALRTPPFKLIISSTRELDAEEAPVVAKLIYEHQPDANGLVAESNVADQLAASWEVLTGNKATLSMRQRIHVLTRVIPPAPASGHFRVATEEDLFLLLMWTEAFFTEADEGAHPMHGELTRSRVRAGDVYVWDNDGIVSCAHISRRTRSGASISLVYTPPVHRGRGYASNCVAALSSYLLTTGSAWCSLHTDVSNPTSNKIYTAIGYEPLTDIHEFGF